MTFHQESVKEIPENSFKDIRKYKSELETLLTLNFRLANSQSISF